jgi:DNA-binding LacI/PurR family transcriptional regulator
MGRVTLRDVAEASGVSRATVSFVLNDAPDQAISATTRERVRRVAAQLGYVPNGLARALREGASRIVVLEMAPGLEGAYSRGYVGALDDELAAHDHILLVRHGAHTAGTTQRVLDAIAPRAVLRFGAPYLGGTGDGLDDSGGGWQNGLAAHTALQVRHLTDRGHTQIAMALPDGDAPLAEIRTRFANETLAALGVAPVTPVVVPRPRGAGAEAVRALRREHPGITALAALNDDVACRTLAALNDLGVAVPGEVAVIGYDETEAGALVTPALTTVHVDAEAHGRMAARRVLGLDAAGLTGTPGRVIVRDSA